MLAGLFQVAGELANALKPEPVPHTYNWHMIRIHALLPAAGKGVRFGEVRPKQYQPLLGKPVMWHSVMAFLNVRRVSSVHVVLAKEDDEFCEAWEGFTGNDRLHIHRVGGGTRSESVRNGLMQMDVGDRDWVAVHDAVRPCIGDGLINTLLSGLNDEEHGRVAAIRVADTLKCVEAETGRIVETAKRKHKWLAQTPQVFRYRELLESIPEKESNFPDESSAFERCGRNPLVVEGEPANIKITTQFDLQLAEAIMTIREGV